MDIQRIEEFKITDHQKKVIHQLLSACFSGYPKGRIYYKQLPNFRYLAYLDDQLIGHLAVEHRMIAIDQKPYSILGVVDICVAKEHRGKNIAATLLLELEKLGIENNIDFIILTATEHHFYLKNGYKLFSNNCRWLFINEHQTLGVKNRYLPEALLIKSLGEKKWSEGIVDFLGTVF